MKIYLVSIAVGLLVGVIYGVLGVRSPAPPVIALVGLLGVLVGEQLVSIARHHLQGNVVSAAWISTACLPKISGVTLVERRAAIDNPRADGDPES